MCVIIWKPKNTELSEETIREAWEANSDGAGIMYSEKGKVFIRKPFFKLKRFLSCYRKLRHKSLVLHFRISTSGKEDKTNTHPHRLSNTMGVCHNGVITRLSATGPLSDTVLFCREVLGFLPERWIDDPAYVELVSGYVGTDKLVVLNGEGAVCIVNEEFGDWKEGVWFSNLNHEYIAKYSAYKYMGTSSTWSLQCGICETSLLTIAERSMGVCEACDVMSEKYSEPIEYCDLCMCVLLTLGEVHVGVCDRCSGYLSKSGKVHNVPLLDGTTDNLSLDGNV